jgi:purine-binding chemotaxis protein CheW
VRPAYGPFPREIAAIIVRVPNRSLAERLAVTIDAVASTLAPAPAATGDTARTPLAVLAALAADGPLPLGLVAARVGIAKSTASAIVDRLADRGLLRSERDLRDARRLALRITPSGQLELAAVPPRDVSRLVAAVAALPAADAAELERTLGLLGAALGEPTSVGAVAAGDDVPRAEADLRLLSISLAGDEYALALDRVREVLAYTAPRSIASPLPWFSGVVGVRNGLLPVCDLRHRLGIAADSPAPPHAYVVVEGPEGPAALAVDRVIGLVTVAAAEVAPPVGGGVAVSGIAAAGERLLVLLDVDRLLSA